jgi:hypothetical protein
MRGDATLVIAEHAANWGDVKCGGGRRAPELSVPTTYPVAGLKLTPKFSGPSAGLASQFPLESQPFKENAARKPSILTRKAGKVAPYVHFATAIIYLADRASICTCGPALMIFYIHPPPLLITCT